MTMTIGEILAALEPAADDTQVRFAFGGASPTTIGCYRGYYDEAALGFTDGQYGSEIQTVKGLRDELERASRRGVLHTGWKGGEFQFTTDTPLHVDNPGNCTDTDIVRVEVQEYQVVIHTAQEAPHE